MKKLRDQIGLTQTDMAKLIGFSKATGSLYEKGLRELNPKALSMLSTIEIFFGNLNEIDAADKINLNEQKAIVVMLKKLTFDLKGAALKYEIIKEKLLNMEDAYASNRKLWRLLTDLKTNLNGIAANPYVGVLEVRCLEKLKSCGLHQQILLRHQMAILVAEIASAQQIIEEYQGFGLPVER